MERGGAYRKDRKHARSRMDENLRNRILLRGEAGRNVINFTSWGQFHQHACAHKAFTHANALVLNFYFTYKTVPNLTSMLI